MKRISLVAMMAMILLFQACGLEKKSSRVYGAPSTQEEAGLVTTCASIEQAQELLQKYPKLKYRVISEKKKIIEFINISQSDLQNFFPHSRTIQNKIYQDLAPAAQAQAQTTDYPFYGAHTRRNMNALEQQERFPYLGQIDALNNHNGGENIIIAIVDTGVYYNHPDLSPNILTNSSDPHGDSGNNQDDDQNGYSDDFVGWDFYNNDAYPLDDNGHGTHVAGLAAGVLNGVAPKAKILPIKVMSARGSGDLGTIAQGIIYAVERGAKIINLSLGGSSQGVAQSELNSILAGIQMAKFHDVLLVAASGNGGDDGIGDCTDANPIVPAAVNEENILSVAAVNASDEITSYSNYGVETVDVAAPGGDSTTGGLLSVALPYCYGPCASNNAPYVSMAGTSMATPVVSGLAAVVMSEKATGAVATKNRIMNNVLVINGLEDKVQSSGVVNLAQSL